MRPMVHPPQPQPPAPGASPAAYPPGGHPPPPAGTDPALKFVLPVGRTPLSLIAGYMGLLALFVVPAPLALILGIWALDDLQNKPEMSGAGRAWFAIVVGALGSILLGLIALQ